MRPSLAVEVENNDYRKFVAGQGVKIEFDQNAAKIHETLDEPGKFAIGVTAS
jgi:hypothetical protein